MIPNLTNATKTTEIDAQSFDSLFGKHQAKICCSKCLSKPTAGNPIIRRDGAVKGIYKRFKCKLCNKTFSEKDILLKLQEIEKIDARNQNTEMDPDNTKDQLERSFLQDHAAKKPKIEKKNEEASFLDELNPSDLDMDDDFDDIPNGADRNILSLTRSEENPILARLENLERNVTNLTNTVSNLSTQMVQDSARDEKLDKLFEMMMGLQQKLEIQSYASIAKKPIEGPTSAPSCVEQMEERNPETGTINRQPDSRNAAIQDFIRTCTVSGINKTKPIQPKSKVEFDLKLRLVYIGGVAFMPVSTFKNKLFDLRYQLSKIKNIRWIGRSTIELLIDEEYSNQFISRLNEFGGFVRHLDNFNLFESPRFNQKESEIAEAKERAIRGITIQRDKSNDRAVFDFFDSLINELGRDARKISLKYSAPSKITEIPIEPKSTNEDSLKDESMVSRVNAAITDLIDSQFWKKDMEQKIQHLADVLEVGALIHDLDEALSGKEHETTWKDIIMKLDYDCRILKLAMKASARASSISTDTLQQLLIEFPDGLLKGSPDKDKFKNEWIENIREEDIKELLIFKLIDFEQLINQTTITSLDMNTTNV